MDLIKLLDVSSPKNIKNVINTLIREYENVAENFPTKLSDLTDDETHRLVTDNEKASWNAKLSTIPNDYKTKTENDSLYQPKGNYLTSFTETDPTVPAWAKAATKPSYNYSEINNTPTIPTVNNSTITIKQGEETKGTFTLNQTEDKTIELDAGGGGSNVTLYEELGQNTDGALTQKKSTEELAKMANKDGSNLNTEDISSWIEKLGLGLPLGTLIHSTKILKNAGLHLADGGELMIGGVYDAFCQYVINNQDEFPNILYDDEDLTVEGAKTALEKWQEEFATYGQCGYYVITDTYVKLPAITKLTGGLISTEMDKMGTEAKPVLPNIKGYFTGTLNGSDGGTGKHEGAFYAYSTGADSNSWGGNSGWNNTSTEGFDASRSNPIYSSKDRVEAEHLKFPYYIVVATVTKTDIEVNIDNVITDLNDKIGKNECVRYPVEKWHSEDYSTWYTIYNDGYKECAGKATTSSSSSAQTIQLPVVFKNSNFIVVMNKGYLGTSNAVIGDVSVTATYSDGSTTSYFQTRGYNSPVRYYACGY